MRLLKFSLWIIVLAIMIIIFLLSAQPAEKLDKVSKSVTEAVVNIMPVIKDKPIKEKQHYVKLLDDYIRKLAHFFLFFLLGLFFMTATSVSMNDKKAKDILFLTVLVCFIYAVSDEVHQIFVDGRSFQVLDILLDLCGSFFGGGMIFLLAVNTNWIRRDNLGQRN